MSEELKKSIVDHLSSRVNAVGFAPMVFHGMEPRGILSLKHAAACAGPGVFGRSEQVYHPQYGSLLRLGAVVTNAGLAGDPLIVDDPCPPKCTASQQVCPSKSFDNKGKFRKMTCLQYSIKHAIYPLALKDEIGLKHIEMKKPPASFASAVNMNMQRL